MLEKIEGRRLFPLFPLLFPMKRWDRMPWSSFSECWAWSQLFHSPLALSSSCPLSQWCHPNHLILCHPLYLLPSIFPSIKVFSNKSALLIGWPKYWSFSFNISSSNEHSGLISFRMDWLDLLCNPKDSQESSPTPQFKSINSSVLRFLHSPTLTSIHDYWKNHSLD